MVLLCYHVSNQVMSMISDYLVKQGFRAQFFLICMFDQYTKQESTSHVMTVAAADWLAKVVRESLALP